MAEIRGSSNQDIISNLPDSLIHHIFSFTDMKYAVQTCILSKRWMHVWKSLPTLNVDSDEHWSSARRSGDGLIPFIDKVFNLRDRSDIQRFQLRCRCMHVSNINCSQVRRWIVSAVSLNVQEIHMDIECIRGDFEIPSCLVTCKSLTKLELVLIPYRYLAVKKKIILPTSITLPRLKSLRLNLESLEFDDENLMNKLFSCCPALESLELYCEYRNMKLIVSLPQLKHFIYNENENSDSIQLCAPNLTYLNLLGYISSDYTLENLGSLTSADIFMCTKRSEEEKDWKIPAQKKGLYANRMMKLLGGLYNVKDLILGEYVLKALGGAAPNMLRSQPHQLFNNLRTLKLRTWLTRGCLQSITYLLRISPGIESLTLELLEFFPNCDQCYRGGYLDFDEVTYDDSGVVGNTSETWLLLPSMIDHLKIARIQGIKGCFNELKLLEFLLKSAIVLEKLILVPCSRYSKQEVLTKFREKLLTYPRASKDTSICLDSEWIYTYSLRQCL